ncbi:4-hydroxybutyryl-CoA dehydratase / vinylacetyl-CoA-Delta-isomerase [Thermosyntropha lipolytica DSM 11003]|uniref:4-hydroxybutyryl-CoA dehydratase / vinylacetyl-CoA-Delta-isomerase n=2 Tax=Thermosyntropha TaxID=54293 RepID=A0A1M5LUI5_9FIRM|nr:4-hydroxyphenylacetate 3-hydroxylase family protein [Thermosyntropha lipolytica]SHG68560.1 4-hydroxybutyryl-CoA dehydratase / vinylacetyl-CoA-Delta-isomerase [Thermosyntropha lipolytica DSM 11003]
MMTAQEYIESLRNLRPRKIYLLGEKVENPVDHPMIRPSINCCAMTYKLAELPEYQDIMTAKSALTGNTINRFVHLHQSTEDLIKKVKMLRLVGQMTGACFQRCVGMDALNAVWSTTYEIDQKYGTNYHERFKQYLIEWEEKDWTVDGCMTDPKGNRSLPPSKQADPDLYVHIVEKRSDGIVVRGAKMHQTGIINSHEILVMPTMSLSLEEADYAVCFAVPSDDPSLIYIYGRQSCDTRKLEKTTVDVGNIKYGGQEAIVIFNDTFVPWERVFMCGETDFAGMLVERFAGYHRQSYGGCKVGNGDVLIGAAAAIAEYNGVAKASHIKDKIIEMVHLNETLYSCGIACSAEGRKTPAGNYLIDIMLANVCKQNVTRYPYEIARLAQDIAGGIVATMPSDADFKSPEIGHWCNKFMIGDAKYSAEERQRMLRLIETMTMGAIAVGYLTESMHGAGSPQAQRILIQRYANLEAKKALARRICGIDEDNLL